MYLLTDRERADPRPLRYPETHYVFDDERTWSKLLALAAELGVAT